MLVVLLSLFVSQQTISVSWMTYILNSISSHFLKLLPAIGRNVNPTSVTIDPWTISGYNSGYNSCILALTDLKGPAPNKCSAYFRAPSALQTLSTCVHIIIFFFSCAVYNLRESLHVPYKWPLNYGRNHFIEEQVVQLHQRSSTSPFLSRSQLVKNSKCLRKLIIPSLSLQWMDFSRCTIWKCILPCFASCLPWTLL